MRRRDWWHRFLCRLGNHEWGQTYRYNFKDGDGGRLLFQYIKIRFCKRRRCKGYALVGLRFR